MKSKKLLLGFTLLACTTLLVACQNSTHKKDTTQNSVKTKTSKKETVSDEERQRNLREFYEEVPELAGNSYNNDIYKRSQEAWNNNQENIFKGQASLKVSNDYLPEELSKLRIKIDGYDVASRRLKLTVTNNYDKTLIGTKKDSNGNILYGTNFTLYGYSTLSGRAERIKIMQISLTNNLKAGESIQLQVLSERLASGTTDYAKKFQNTELDSKYYLISTNFTHALWDVTPDLVMGEENVPDDIVVSSLANIYVIPKLVFETYPNSAPNNKELQKTLFAYKYY